MRHHDVVMKLPPVDRLRLLHIVETVERRSPISIAWMRAVVERVLAAESTTDILRVASIMVGACAPIPSAAFDLSEPGAEPLIDAPEGFDFTAIMAESDPQLFFAAGEDLKRAFPPTGLRPEMMTDEVVELLDLLFDGQIPTSAIPVDLLQTDVWNHPSTGPGGSIPLGFVTGLDRPFTGKELQAMVRSESIADEPPFDPINDGPMPLHSRET